MNAVTAVLALALLGAEGTAPNQDKAPRDTWELTLPEAIRTGLGNAPTVRTVCERVEEDGQVYVTIAPATRAAAAAAVAAPWRFRAETMALVRTIEQQYWTLAQQQEQLRATERALETAREVLRRERADLRAGRGNAADVAEAEQRLEQFNLDAVTKTSDVITAERELRKALGLRAADSRAIVPATAPVAKEIKAEWRDCLNAMLTMQPDVAQQRMVVCASGLQLLMARGPSALLSHLGDCAEETGPTPDARQAGARFRQEQAFLQQVVHQTIHSLARFFLEMDANYKQFKTASRLRAAAAQRLEAQRAFYEEGRIPIDRYLDAVSQYASAVAQEAQIKTTYNISIVALEEAKGTLLNCRQVTVDDTPPATPPAQVASSPAEPTADPEVRQTGAESDPAPAAAGPAPGRNVTFDITIGETRPIRVRGTISIAPAD
jgi:hypothetical protein